MDFGAGFPAATVSDFDNSHAIWATEEDYQNWNGCPIPDPPPDSRPQYRSGSEPPSKKNRTPQGSSDSGNNSSSSNNNNNNNNRSKAIGKMFYKTKLCCKFRAGVCPYITNCNFAHGIEELRRPPPNWQEIVAANDEVEPPPREEHQIPTFSSSESRSESQRAYKGRHCKKFYTEEGCPYGESCTFLHDEQSRARESVAISLSPSVGGSGYGNGAGNGGQSQKPSNWKTRICNKWETTGSCPFGSKCHFAHGFLELHKYGGGPMEMDGRDSNVVVAESKHNGTPLKAIDTVRTSATLAHHSDVYHMGVGLPSQRPSALSIQRTAQRPHWKGPDKISKIYGDWIDDIE